eukprot:TRINITY_DN55338_c0_g1_i1.p1 TRINITY_DN55338_c0_g1~~TRINITY_DN55338_c0_g1_i1.p1  ORF type:complete len:301 (-),score=57.65 TRINITY_DN55338_c0_g1_i1:208-1089(-)
MVSCIEMYVLKPWEVSAVGVSTLRLSRTAKLVRTLRIVRTFQIFSGLRVLVKAVASSLMALLWSMMLLTVCMLIGSLLMVGLVADFIKDQSNAFDKRYWAWLHYGTSARSLYTMYEVTLSGCWPNYVRPLTEDGGSVYLVFFLCYITFVVFAVIRIITAIFLKETMDAASRDANMMTVEQEIKRTSDLNHLADLFNAADSSGDGELSSEEFNQFLKNPKVVAAFGSLELDLHEGIAMFHLLDNGDGIVTFEEFVQGVSRLKGQARSLDVVALQVEMKKVLRHVLEISEHCVHK